MNNETKDCETENKDDGKTKKGGKVANTIKLNPPIKESRSLSFRAFLELDTEEDLEEGLTVAQRVKRGSNTKRREPQLQAARKRALARHAEKKRLEKRSRTSAIDKVKSKYTGGQKIDDLSYGDKSRIEDILKTKKGAVAALSRKLLNSVRDRENARHGKSIKSKDNK